MEKYVDTEVVQRVCFEFVVAQYCTRSVANQGRSRYLIHLCIMGHPLVCNCIDSLDVVIGNGLIFCSGIHWQFDCFIVERLGLVKRIRLLLCAHGPLAVDMGKNDSRRVVERLLVKETGRARNVHVFKTMGNKFFNKGLAIKPIRCV